jgi:5-methylcytosine-specific restriction endonuclease McrA
MRAQVRKKVRTRAAKRCEYCRLHEDDSPLLAHQVEHIIPRKHGGSDEVDNLAFACVACNLFKGPNLSGIDPDTGALTPLFHPRQQRWNDHFALEGLELVGLTPIGRVTIAVLRMNSEVHLRLRVAAES